MTPENEQLLVREIRNAAKQSNQHLFDVRILDATLHFGMMANGEIVTITFSMSWK